MDMTFRESEPYYGNPLEKTSPDRREEERLIITGEISLDQQETQQFDAGGEHVEAVGNAIPGGVETESPEKHPERQTEVRVYQRRQQSEQRENVNEEHARQQQEQKQ